MLAITPEPEPDLKQIIDRINRRLTNLEQQNPLQGGMVISGGGLTAVDPTTGNRTGFIGLGDFSDGSDRKQMETVFYRADGTVAFIIADLGTTLGHPFAQALQMWDHNGNIWAADDIISGQGIARPYLSMGTWTDNSEPVMTTTSTSFANLQTLNGVKQHPKIEGQIITYADSGTTGVLEMIDQASNVLFTHNIASGEFQYTDFGPVALAGTHEQSITLTIQAKVSTGSGKVGARGVSCLGVQS